MSVPTIYLWIVVFYVVMILAGWELAVAVTP
jgi:hypothetical protein